MNGVGPGRYPDEPGTDGRIAARTERNSKIGDRTLRIDENRDLIRSSAVQARELTFLWAHDDRSGFIPDRTLTLLVGEAGAGKSTFVAWLASEVSRGTLPGVLEGEPATTIYATTEDAIDTVFIPRLIAAGADRDLVQIFRMGDERTAMQRLKQAIIDADAKLVILDPISSWIIGDQNAKHVVRPALEQLLAVCNTLHVTVVGIGHPRKGASTRTIEAMAGSAEFANIARSVLLFAVQDETDIRLFEVSKLNGAPRPPDQEYEIVDDVIVERGQSIRTARFSLIGDAEATVKGVMAERVTPTRDDNFGANARKVIDGLEYLDRPAKLATLGEFVKKPDREVDLVYASNLCNRLARAGRIRKVSRGEFAPVSWNEPKSSPIARPLQCGDFDESDETDETNDEKSPQSSVSRVSTPSPPGDETTIAPTNPDARASSPSPNGSLVLPWANTRDYRAPARAS
jgi:hypothetical protein